MPMKAVEKAIAERDRFLKEHPKHVEFQKEIDRVLDGAVDAEARIKALTIVMLCRQSELLEQLDKLGIAQKIKNEADRTE
jgi:hypothetical protein